ncbi:hypothetical protein [Isoptericola variabilis]|uniref:Uncharacterized protein n=1 Tax=Isoptericola variabilis (strain 225) TaxID=743718 RepID=F6FUV8_ISOV2|nr:hypothetical protein [Isoptericola variabilis]AEG44298.1 hypothetical protein Isova_1544 [Isoptericola variabilis 225]TWH28861.1 hypothetical protein L600_003600000040 [Isoptericola variabilis J7]
MSWWWFVWVPLVLATAGGAFLLGRSLWRAVVRLLREVAAAGGALSSSGERVSAAVAQAEARRVDTSPTLFDDVTVLRERVRERREARRARRDARFVRHRATWQEWSRASWLERRTAQKRAAAGGGLRRTRLP